jgi:hypothetical protein
MNYFRDMLNNNLYDLEDDIDFLFEQFVDEVNNQPFNFENDPSFMLNQSVVNNIYLLRRTIDLYPERISRRRRIVRQPAIDVFSSNDDNSITFNTQYINTPPVHTPINNTPPTNTPTGTRRSSFDSSLPNGLYQRRNAIDASSLHFDEGVWISDFSRRFTDNILNSLFTNFNDFIEQQLQNYTDLEDVKVTLTEEEFNKLDKVTDKELITNKQCNICLEDFKENDIVNDDSKLIQLKCNHIYHKDCIGEWLTKQSTKCPSCRFCCRDGVKTE